MNPYFLAINYHYIGSANRYPFPGITGISVSEFADQLDQLAQSFEFVGASDIEQAIRGVRSLPSKSVVITFDDGLKEQFTEAVPILEQRGIPFICFVNTSPLKDLTPCFIHKLHYLRAILSSEQFLSRARSIAEMELSFSLPEVDNAMIPSGYYPYDKKSDRELKYLMNFVLPEKVSRTIVDSVFKDYSGDEEFCRWFYLSNDNAKELHFRFGALGLHGHNHLSLASLPETEARKEIELCSEILKAIAGKQPFCMSYPYGYRDSVSFATAKIAQECGIRFGFTMEMAFNRNVMIQPHLLGRINNNEAPGHPQATFSCNDEEPVVHDPLRMGLHRTWFVNDLPDKLECKGA